MLCEEVGDAGWAKKAQILIVRAGLKGSNSSNVVCEVGK